MKRVLVASFQHESNSFNPSVTKKEDFRLILGDDVYNHLSVNCPFSGIIETLLSGGVKVIPTVFANAVPHGEIDPDFFNHLMDELTARIKAAWKACSMNGTSIDAVTLALHGSMRVKTIGAAEGLILARIKELIPDAPIFISLDTHATMTETMYRSIDAVAAYKTAPHIDRYETGALAATMTLSALERDARPCTAWVPVPLLVAGEQSATTVEPMAGLIDRLKEVERKDGILAASILMGFPWADTEDSRAGVLVTARSKENAKKEALALAALLWQKRAEFSFETEAYSEEEALDIVFDALNKGAATPIYLSDSGDNPTAGSSGDCVAFLDRLLKDPRRKAVSAPILYGGIYDKEAMRRLKGHVGETIEVTFGAAYDRETSTPLTRRGVVKKYLSDWRGSLVPSDLAHFFVDGVDLVLASEHIGYTSDKVFRDLGLEPEASAIVVVKLGYLTPEHKALAQRAILVLTKGSTNEDLVSLDYQKVPRPLYPLDRTFEFVPKAHEISTI